MRDPKRIPELLAAIEALWKQYPDWRLGQLIVNVGERSDPFYVEDYQLLERIIAWEITHRPQTK